MTAKNPAFPDCFDCEGRGSYPCQYCRGSADCGDCGGEGVVPCDDCESMLAYLRAVGTDGVRRFSAWRQREAVRRYVDPLTLCARQIQENLSRMAA